MNRQIVTGACALFLVACTKSESQTPAVAVQTDAKTVLELGRDV